MIADSSALVAILRNEPEAQEFRILVAGNLTRACAATVLETCIVMTSARHHEVDHLLLDAEIGVVPFDAQHAQVAREAYTRREDPGLDSEAELRRLHDLRAGQGHR